MEKIKNFKELVEVREVKIKLQSNFKITWKELMEQIKQIKNQNECAYVNIPGGSSFQRVIKINTEGTAFIQIENKGYET